MCPAVLSHSLECPQSGNDCETSHSPSITFILCNAKYAITPWTAVVFGFSDYRSVSWYFTVFVPIYFLTSLSALRNVKDV